MTVLRYLNCISWKRNLLYLSTPPRYEQDVIRAISKQSTAGLNSKFSVQTVCQTNAKELCLSQYLPIAEVDNKCIGLVLFGWVLWHINHCRLFKAKSSLYMY